jgi:hypothetical protein
MLAVGLTVTVALSVDSAIAAAKDGGCAAFPLSPVRAVVWSLVVPFSVMVTLCWALMIVLFVAVAETLLLAVL